MSEVFADTFYFLALLNPRDKHHAAAMEASRRLSSRLITTHWVLMEVGDALSAPPVRERTWRFIGALLADKNVTVISDLAPWFEKGLRRYGERADKSWSLTDCISFVVMEDRMISTALTGDQHFTQAGFVVLLSTAMT